MIDNPAIHHRRSIRLRAYEPDAPLVMKGAELQKFKVVIDDRPGSVIVEYCRALSPAEVQKVMKE